MEFFSQFTSWPLGVNWKLCCALTPIEHIHSENWKQRLNKLSECGNIGFSCSENMQSTLFIRKERRMCYIKNKNTMWLWTSHSPTVRACIVLIQMEFSITADPQYFLREWKSIMIMRMRSEAGYRNDDDSVELVNWKKSVLTLFCVPVSKQHCTHYCTFSKSV